MTDRIQKLLTGLLLGFALFLPITISAAEGCLFLAILVWLFQLRGAERRAVWKSPYFLPIVAFVAIAALSTLWSVRPEMSLRRLHRLVIPFSIFVIGWQFRKGGKFVLPLMLAFVVGCTMRAVYDVFRVSVEVANGADLLLIGNMRDPQMYMVALCMLAACMGHRSWENWRPFQITGIGILVVGLILHFKRGVWISLFLVLVWAGVRMRRWGILIALAAVVASALVLKPVRTRLLQLDETKKEEVGGRFALWRNVAPVLLKEYPQGMGWCAVTHDDLAARTPYLQKKLNHLHNNILQVALETGWVGLLAWLGWMLTAFLVMWRSSRGPPGEAQTAISLGVWASFTCLLFNGMVEYNFGDTEILMLMCLLMGLSEAMRKPANAGVA